MSIIIIHLPFNYGSLLLFSRKLPPLSITPYARSQRKLLFLTKYRLTSFLFMFFKENNLPISKFV